MQNLFKEFQEGLEIKKFSKDYYNEEKDIDKMISTGILLQDGMIKINPLVRKSKSYSIAKKTITAVVSSWLDNIDKAQDIQIRFREEMIEYFKQNPIGCIHEGYAQTSEDCPEKYKSGKGFVYVQNNEVISMHVGYIQPDNYPKNCDRFKYESRLGMIKIENY
tara:strand:+ start:754 stop:1242 length:489 start_codon:yes stop_codon:yes gene_type:complete